MPSTTNITSSYAGKASEFFVPALFEGKTLSTAGLTIDAEVPYKYAARSFDITGLVQTGSSCSWNDNGTTSVTERVIDVKDHYVNLTYCGKDFKTSWNFEDSKSIPADVEAELEPKVQSAIKASVESLVWKGNTTGATNGHVLAQFNGFIRLLKTQSVIQLTGTTHTQSNIVAELGKVVRALPDAIKDKAANEVIIFVSKSSEMLYKLAQNSQGMNTSVGDKPLDFLGYEVRGVAMPVDSQIVCGLRSSFHIASNVGLDAATYNMKNMYPVNLEKSIRVEASYAYNVAITNANQIVLAG